MRLLRVLAFSILAFFSCKEDGTGLSQKREFPEQNFDPQKVKDQFVKANQLVVKKESDNMDAYERSHKLSFVKTTSGIRYLVYKPSVKGDSIKSGMEITVKYTLSLLDGTVCYTSDEDGLKTFVVEQEELESGIHRGLQYLKRGDKALLLIPSPLAHGLLGDFKKIPPQMPIVYDVEIK